MPFVVSKVSVPISREQELELKARLGRAISFVPGKSEAYLLLSFEDNCRLWLRGDDSEPIAYIEASIFASEDRRGYDAFSAETASAFSEILGIAPDHVYIRFADIPVWSVGGLCFDRRLYR